MSELEVNPDIISSNPSAVEKWMMKLRTKKGLAEGNPRSNGPGSATASSDASCCGTNVLRIRNSSE